MIRLTIRAEADLRHIDDSITADNGAGVAARILEAILTSIEHLGRFRSLAGQGAAHGRASS